MREGVLASILGFGVALTALLAPSAGSAQSPPQVVFLPAEFPTTCAVNLVSGQPIRTRSEGNACSDPPDFCSGSYANLDAARDALGQGSCQASGLEAPSGRPAIESVATLFLIDDRNMSPQLQRHARPALGRGGVVVPRVIRLGTGLMLVGNRYPEQHQLGGTEAWQARVRELAGVRYHYRFAQDRLVPFVVSGQTEGMEQYTQEMARCLGNMPEAHRSHLVPIYVVPSLPGQDGGGGFFPREASGAQGLASWVGHAEATGLPDAVIEEELASNISGIVAISQAGFTAETPSYDVAVVRESAHALQSGGLALTHGNVTAAQLAQGESGPKPEHEASAYARWIARPEQICTQPPSGETAEACSERVAGLLRGSPGFDAVPDSWQPLAGCRTNVALDAGSASGSSQIAFSYHGLPVGHDGQVLENLPPETLADFFSAVPMEDEPEETESESGVESRQAGPRPLAQTRYGRRCAAQQVPIPPPFSSSDWQHLGTLTTFFALQSVPHVQVLAYKPTNAAGEPVGLCIALPRGEPSGEVKLMGVICQSTQTGKACFWDNWDRTASPAVKLEASDYRSLDINRFQDGLQLRENCTDCHRGANVYIIHGNTVLAGSGLPGNVREPLKRYSPMGRSGWVNPKNSNQPDECSTCHEIPGLSKAYCNTVLKPSIGTTMPPPTWPDGSDYDVNSDADWRTEYAADLTQINRECAAFP